MGQGEDFQRSWQWAGAQLVLNERSWQQPVSPGLGFLRAQNSLFCRPCVICSVCGQSAGPAPSLGYPDLWLLDPGASRTGGRAEEGVWGRESVLVPSQQEGPFFLQDHFSAQLLGQNLSWPGAMEEGR